MFTDDAENALGINGTFGLHCWLHFSFRFDDYGLLQNRVAEILLEESKYFFGNKLVQA
jgi:hypothetical protein